MSVTLNMDRSQLLMPEPRTGFRPPLPKVPWAGTLKAPTLNHSSRVRLDFDRIGFPVMSGRSQIPESPNPALSFWRHTLTGRPERKVEIPFTCQPLRRAFLNPVVLSKNGSCQT